MTAPAVMKNVVVTMLVAWGVSAQTVDVAPGAVEAPVLVVQLTDNDHFELHRDLVFDVLDGDAYQGAPSHRHTIEDDDLPRLAPPAPDAADDIHIVQVGGYTPNLTYTWRHGETVIAEGPLLGHEHTAPGAVYTCVVRVADAHHEREASVLVAVAMGLEGDVAPRPMGDGALLVNDWVQVGRFVAGLDVPASPSEFQRADCAPLDTAGEGQLQVNDWVQAGRYVAGLDPPQPQAGPIAPDGS